MNSTVIEVTTDDLRNLVDDLVEEKLLSFFGDPEADMEIRDELKTRLLRQRREMQKGENGHSFIDAMEKLGLD